MILMKEKEFNIKSFLEAYFRLIFQKLFSCFCENTSGQNPQNAFYFPLKFHFGSLCLLLKKRHESNKTKYSCLLRP